MSYVKLIVDVTDSDYSVKVKYDSMDNKRHYKVCCPMSELSRLDRNIVNNYLPVEMCMGSNTSVEIEIRSFCTAEMVEIYNQMMRNFAPRANDINRVGTFGEGAIRNGTSHDIIRNGTSHDIIRNGTSHDINRVGTETITQSVTNPFTIKPNFTNAMESNNSLFMTNGMSSGNGLKAPTLTFTKLSPQAITVLEEVKAYAICHGKHPDFTLTTEKNKLKIRNYISSVYGKPISYDVANEVMEALRQHYLWK